MIDPKRKKWLDFRRYRHLTTTWVRTHVAFSKNGIPIIEGEYLLTGWRRGPIDGKRPRGNGGVEGYGIHRPEQQGKSSRAMMRLRNKWWDEIED